MKLLILGPFNSGKSTFIRKICRGSSISLDKSGTTVALDHGMTEVYGIRVYLFGTPGLRRFEVLRKILSKGADGAIMVVDSVNRASFEEARELYKAFSQYLPKNIPLLIAPNKQDVDGAVPPEEVAKALEIPEEAVVAVVGTSAITGEGIDRILSLTVLSIVSRYIDILKGVKETGEDGFQAISERITYLEGQELKSLLLWLSWRGLLAIDWENDKYSLPRRVKEVTDILEFASKK